jgi:hypothetical protein
MARSEPVDVPCNYKRHKEAACVQEGELPARKLIQPLVHGHHHFRQEHRREPLDPQHCGLSVLGVRRGDLASAQATVVVPGREPSLRVRPPDRCRSLPRDRMPARGGLPGTVADTVTRTPPTSLRATTRLQGTSTLSEIIAGLGASLSPGRLRQTAVRPRLWSDMVVRLGAAARLGPAV